MHRQVLMRFKSKKAFSPIFFAKYLSQPSQFEQQKIIFFHILLKSTYHDTLITSLKVLKLAKINATIHCVLHRML